MKTVSKHKEPSIFITILMKSLDVKTIIVFIVFTIILFLFITLLTSSCKKETMIKSSNEAVYNQYKDFVVPYSFFKIVAKV